MKPTNLIILCLLALPVAGKSQVFVSDSIRKFSTTENRIIETIADTTYSIDRSFNTINLSHRIYGISQGVFKCIDDVKWSIKIEKKTLPKRNGNEKMQFIEGWLLGINKHERIAYNLIDRNNDGEYESLEFTSMLSMDVEETIFCHLK